MLVINKPHGLAVHGGSGLSFGVIELIRQIYPNEKFLELIHRLDKETSGVLLIAKKRAALVEIQKQIRSPQTWALLSHPCPTLVEPSCQRWGGVNQEIPRLVEPHCQG